MTAPSTHDRRQATAQSRRRHAKERYRTCRRFRPVLRQKLRPTRPSFTSSTNANSPRKASTSNAPLCCMGCCRRVGPRWWASVTIRRWRRITRRCWNCGPKGRGGCAAHGGISWKRWSSWRRRRVVKTARRRGRFGVDRKEQPSRRLTQPISSATTPAAAPNRSAFTE